MCLQITNLLHLQNLTCTNLYTFTGGSLTKTSLVRHDEITDPRQPNDSNRINTPIKIRLDKEKVEGANFPARQTKLPISKNLSADNDRSIQQQQLDNHSPADDDFGFLDPSHQHRRRKDGVTSIPVRHPPHKIIMAESLSPKRLKPNRQKLLKSQKTEQSKTSKMPGSTAETLPKRKSMDASASTVTTDSNRFTSGDAGPSKPTSNTDQQKSQKTVRSEPHQYRKRGQQETSRSKTRERHSNTVDATTAAERTRSAEDLTDVPDIIPRPQNPVPGNPWPYIKQSEAQRSVPVNTCVEESSTHRREQATREPSKRKYRSVKQVNMKPRTGSDQVRKGTWPFFYIVLLSFSKIKCFDVIKDSLITERIV